MGKNGAQKLDVKLLGVSEVAEILGVSTWLARETMLAIGAIRVGSRPLIKVDARALERWIEAGGSIRRAKPDNDNDNDNGGEPSAADHVETRARPSTRAPRPKYLARKAVESRFAPIKPATRAKGS